MKNFLLLCLVIGVSACSEQARNVEMSLNKPLYEYNVSEVQPAQHIDKNKVIDLQNKFKNINVTLNEQSDNKANFALYSIELTPEHLKAALENSLSASDWLNTQQGIYSINAEINNVERIVTLLGESRSFEVVVTYKVLDNNNQVVFDKKILSHFQEESFIKDGIKYIYGIRLMFEKSVQENIKDFMFAFANHELKNK